MRAVKDANQDDSEVQSIFEGLWWLPSKPERRLPGRLTFSPAGGGVLEVWDELCDCDPRQPTNCHGTIFGLTSAARPISLYDSVARGSSVYRTGGKHAVTTSYHAGFLIAGAHFETLDKAAFPGYTAQFPNLSEWMGDAHADSDWKKAENGEVCELVVSLPLPPNSTLFQGDRFKLNAYSNAGTEPKGERALQISQRRILELEFPSLFPVDDFWPILRRFQDLLSLACAEPVYGHEVVAYQPDAEGLPQTVGLHRWTRDSRGTEQIPFFRMLFTLAELKEKAPSAFDRWFAADAESIEALRPYFAVLYNDELYLETKFVMLVNALESFHRRTGENTALPADKHAEKVGRILASVVGEDDRNWVKEKLSRSNQPSLRERLTELCSRVSPIVERFESGIDVFVAQVSNTRHYLVHYDPSLKAKAIKDQELSILARRVEALCAGLLLNELGFPVKELPHMLSRTGRYRRVVR